VIEDSKRPPDSTDAGTSALLGKVRLVGVKRQAGRSHEPKSGQIAGASSAKDLRTPAKSASSSVCRGSALDPSRNGPVFAQAEPSTTGWFLDGDDTRSRVTFRVRQHARLGENADVAKV
jgi:hypothetical protein